MTKNDEGRVAYLTPELRVALAGQLERAKALERRLGRIVAVGVPASRQGATGQAATTRLPQGVGGGLQEGRRAWPVSSRLPPHRSAQHGAPRRAALGRHEDHRHKTESVYRRYAIVSDADLQEAARKARGHNSGHSHARRG